MILFILFDYVIIKTKDCKGNGEHEEIECQCDESDYLTECFPIKSSSSTDKSLVIDQIAKIINEFK